MVNKEEILDHIIDIIKSFAGSILVILVVSLGVGNILYTIFSSENVIEIYINIYLLLIFFALIIITVSYFLYSHSKIYIYNGREESITANTKLLKRKAPKNQTKRYIYSTRITHWPKNESSPTRTLFRKLLSEKIEKKIAVQRIWQIRSKHDYDSLIFYLEKYKNYDNLSIKYLIGESLLPEILSLFGKVVSVSIPQPTEPIRLTTSMHFYGKGERDGWENYFKILWEISKPIKTANKIHKSEIELLKREFCEPKS